MSIDTVTILNLDYNEDEINEKVDLLNLPNQIIDLSNNPETRLKALEAYYEEKGDDSIDVISTLNGMYQISGSKLIENFFLRICFSKKISVFLKIEASKNLLVYKEKNIERQLYRRQIAYKTLDNTLKDLPNSNLYYKMKTNAIFLLMKNKDYQKNANRYYKEFLNDKTITSKEKFYTIIQLENIDTKYIKTFIKNKFNDKKFLKLFYTTLRLQIKSLFPKTTFDIKNHILLKYVLKYLTRKELESCLFKITKEYKSRYGNCILHAYKNFILSRQNNNYYKNIALQYILQSKKITKTDLSQVEKSIIRTLGMKKTTEIEKANLADTLLNMSSNKELKEKSKQIIDGLSGDTENIFRNNQNVHTQSVSDFTEKVIEFLLDLKFEDMILDFDKIREHIKTMNDEKKIKTSLERIVLDKTLYTKFNISMKNIFIKLYNYITTHDHSTELFKRLNEELIEMNGLCSSGVISRLCNVLSGFEIFNIRIEWEQQIISNIIGRMNAAIKTIDNEDSIFRTTKIYNVVDIWLKKEEHMEERYKLFNELKTLDNDYVLAVYISKNENEIPKILESFKQSVIEEITVPSNEYKNRQNFLLFYKTQLQILKEELYNEFKEFVSDEDFETYYRRGIIKYEEG